MNKIQLIGNLGRDAELTYTPGGAAVTKFSIGVSRGTRDADGNWTNESDWFNIVEWKELAIRSSKLSKGNRVEVEGKHTMRKYTDKNGVERQAWEVIANTIQIVTALPKVEEVLKESSESDDILGDLENHPF